MGYAIDYFLRIPGVEFNRFLAHPCPHLNEPFDVAFEAGAWDWESRLHSSPMRLGANLTGNWTHLDIPEKYSLLKRSPKEVIGEEREFVTALHSRVNSFEKCLLSCVSNVRIYRMDEFLMDQWQAKYDYKWLHDDMVVQEFLKWLHQQDVYGWSVVNDGESGCN